MRLICLLAMLASGVFANANLNDFQERFFYVRNDEGKLLEVRDRSLTMGVSLKKYLKFIKKSLIDSQMSMRSFSTDDKTDLVMDELIKNQTNMREDLSWIRPHIKKSLEQLQSQNLDKLFAHKKFNQVLRKFDQRLQNEWRLFDLNLIARPDQKRFFYPLNVGYQVVKWGLNFAKSQLSEVPVLNLASTIIVRYEELVRERRTYHQNMFLHYLEAYPEDKLGLTKEEADHVYSSIYEARIPWFNIWESNKAEANWHRYGTDIFFTALRSVNRRLITEPGNFGKTGLRHNYAFIDAIVDGEAVILNLFDSKHLVSGKPAIAHYYSDPGKVMMYRGLYQLVQFGIGFVPVADWIKSMVNTYIDSLHKSQALTEGALVAHFASLSMDDDKKHFIKQSLNPFILW